MRTIDELRAVLGARYELEDVPFSAEAVRFDDETPANSFVRVAKLIWSGDAVAMVVARNRYCDSLCESLLSFVESQASHLSIDQAVTLVEGFRAPGFDFDSVLVVDSECEPHFATVNDWLHQHLLVAHPLFRCELVGTESPRELEKIRHSGLCLIDWQRDAYPLIRIRVFNGETGVVTRGNAPVLSNLDYATYETSRLPPDGSSFVEVRNFQDHAIRFVRQSDGFCVEGNCLGMSVDLSPDRAFAFLRRFCTRGLRLGKS